MLLSIGMIVKNEEKYLDKCLNALKPLLENLNSELIIVDTGSTDSTVEIAKRYTDKVYYFEWCDDFSAARNESLKHADGKWFMYIDADEILQNGKEIINFFKSREYQNYNAATYKIKNYNNVSTDNYTYINATRIIKITDKTFFKGKVHERLECHPPIKYLGKTEFNHYGYVFTEKEFLKKKSKRNVELLLMELEQYGPNEILCNYLGDSYALSSNFSESSKYYKQSLDIAVQKNLTEFIPLPFASMIHSLLQNSENEKALKEIELYLTSKSSNSATDIDIYYYKLLASYDQEHFDECVKSFEEYTSLIEKYKKNQLNVSALKYRTVYHTDLESQYTALLNTTISYTKINDYNKAAELLRLPLFDKQEYRYMDVFEKINLELDVMKFFSDYLSIGNLYDKYKEQSYRIEVLIEKFIIQNPSEREKVIENFNNFKFHFSDDYIELMKLRNYDFKNNLSIKNEIEIFLNKANSVNYDIIYFIFKYNLPLNLIARKIPIDFFIKSMQKITTVHNDLPIIINNYCIEFSAQKEICMMAIVYETVLLIIKEHSAICHSLFIKYADCLKIYMSSIYNMDNLTENNLEIFPVSIHFGYHCLNAQKSYEDANYTKYVEHLKKALHSNNKMFDFINILISDFEKKLNENQTDGNLKEFELLAMEVKNNIMSFINSYNFIEAKILLDEYESINPNDPDISEIKNKLQIN